MRVGKDFKIQFAGLSLGAHKYEFEINNTFFESFDYCEIKKGNILIHLQLLKQSSMMVLEFEVTGTVKVNCDLCTGEFDLPIEGNYKLVVKVGGHESGDEDDDIITVGPSEHELNLMQYVYEYIMLSLPIKRVHPELKNGKTGCDPEIIKKLKDHLIEEEEKTDPRWDKLKNIKLN